MTDDLAAVIWHTLQKYEGRASLSDHATNVAQAIAEHLEQVGWHPQDITLLEPKDWRPVFCLRLATNPMTDNARLTEEALDLYRNKSMDAQEWIYYAAPKLQELVAALRQAEAENERLRERYSDTETLKSEGWFNWKVRAEQAEKQLAEALAELEKKKP